MRVRPARAGQPWKDLPDPTTVWRSPRTPPSAASAAGGGRRGGVLMEAIQPAGADDVIAGVQARYVARPTTTAEAAEVVREAVNRDLTIVVRGAGTKQHWALPPNRLDL